MQTTNCTRSNESNLQKLAAQDLSAQLPEFRYLVLAQRLNTLFFNKKIYSLAAARLHQPFDAVRELCGRVKVLALGHFCRRQFAQVPALFVMPPTLQ